MQLMNSKGLRTKFFCLLPLFLHGPLEVADHSHCFFLTETAQIYLGHYPSLWITILPVSCYKQGLGGFTDTFVFHSHK